MADVTGTITDSNGTKDVQLNNAATEATLKLLLQSSLASNQQSLAGIQKLAQQSGLNPAAVAAANQGLQRVSTTGSKLGAGFEALGFAAGFASKAFNEATELTKKLASGSGEASDVFAAFKGMPLGIGLVFSGMQKLAAIQESYLKTYQDLSNSGVNFGGSLTQMRMAASNTYLTLDQFSNLMKKNGETFAKMGGTVDDGAKAFVKVSNQLQKSEMGDQLRALGYTSEQANQGLASYIAMTGGRNKQEMGDTKALSAAAGEYMMQLDELAQITGKNREAQEQELKEATANQAYQSYLLTLDEKGKAKANAAMAEAMAKGGKGAAQALTSQLLGLPPMTKAAQEFTAVAPKMAAANNQMAAAVKDSSKGLNDVKKAGDALGVAANQTKQDLGRTSDALMLSNGSYADTMSSITATANRNEQQGIKTVQDAERQRAEVAKKQNERINSEAAAAAESKKQITELGQQIMNRLMPIFESLIVYVNKATIGFVDFMKYLLDSPKLLSALGVAVLGITAIMVASKAASMAETAKKVTAGFAKGGGVKGALAALGPLGTKANPMYVIALGGGIDSGGRNRSRRGKGAKMPSVKPGMGTRLISGLKGGIGGIVSSLALGAAADYAKEKGMEKTGAGIDVASTAASFAGTGAMLGSVVPGLGTAVGGAVGGLAGGAYGLYKNWGTLFGGNDSGKIPKELPGAAEESASGGANTKSNVSETVAGPSPAEKFMSSMQIDVRELNATMREVLKYMKETADSSRRAVDATKALSGNLFPTP